MERKHEDLVFRALADRSRRRMLDILRDRPGLTVGELSELFDMSRIAAMKHLGILDEANLVVSEREGRCRRLYLNPVPIQIIHDRWTSKFSGEIARGLLILRDQLEQKKRGKKE